MNFSDMPQSGTVLLKDRARLELDGVNDVKAFDEGTVLLQTTLGDMSIEGQTLHVSRLDWEKGLMTIEGRVNAIFYTGDVGEKKKAGFFSRLVK